MLILYASSESFLVKEDGTNCMENCTEAENADAAAEDTGGFHRVVLNCSHCSEETNETEDEEDVFFHDFIILVFCFSSSGYLANNHSSSFSIKPQ